MRKRLESVRYFLSAHCKLRRHQVWKAWLNLGNQEWRDLVKLIRSEVAEEFKKRAIAILLVPEMGSLPFEWQDRDIRVRNYLFLKGHEDLFKVSELPPTLRDFTSELVWRCALEVMRKWHADKEIYVSLNYYNSYIIDFLKILPEDDPTAEKLFAVYQLNDPVVFWNMDDASGYNPLYPILNEDIPEKWKRMAITKMHEIIASEVIGQSWCRTDHEEALPCYLDKVLRCLYGKDRKIHYSVGLFASQLEFVLGLPGIRDRGLFQSHQVGQILQIISGDQYQDLRHRLARYIVLENTKDSEKFTVWDRDTKHAAEAMLEEFNLDIELASALQKLLSEAEERFCKEDEEKSRQNTRENDVLSQMT